MFKPATMIWVLVLGTLALSSCDFRERHAETRTRQLQEANAQYYLGVCVEGLERIRVYPGSGGRIPEGLNGQGCGNPLLGDYALNANQLAKLGSTKIELLPDRLSGYVLTVTALTGKPFVYRDRGTAAAQAEQAGTYESAQPATPAQQAEAREQLGETIPETPTEPPVR